MRVILPETAIVKTWDRGDQPVGALDFGDRLIGYDLRERALKVIDLTFVESAPEEAVLQLHIQHFRWINVFGGTMTNTSRGIARADSSDQFVGYCVINPLRSSLRIVIEATESGPVPGVVLHWEGSDLIWSEGLLVGSD